MINKKLTKADAIKMRNAYQEKLQEYNKMSLEELKALFNSKRLGGAYRAALIEVVKYKLQQEMVTKAKEIEKNNESQTKIEEE